MNFQGMILTFIIYMIPVISLIYIIAGMRLFQQLDSYRANDFSLLMFAVSIYSFGYFLELNSQTLEALLFVRSYEFFGAVFIPCLGIFFIAQLINKRVPGWMKWILSVLSVLLWLLFATNPLHSLIYTSVDMHIMEGFAVIQVTRAPLFYSMMIYDAAFLIYSSIMLYKAYHQEKVPRRKRNFLFLFLTFQIPWITILFILSGFDDYFDPVPVTIMIMGLLFLFNDIKNDVFDLQIKRWEGALAGIGEPAFLVDRDGSILRAGGHADLLFDDHAEVVRCLSDTLSKSMESKVVAFSVQGGMKWFDCRRTDFNKKGNLTSYLLIDVTEKVIQQERIRTSEEKYRLLTEFASDVIWVMNVTSGKLTFVSPSILHLRGITAQEAMNETLEDSMTPESAAMIRDVLKKNVKEFLKNPQFPNYHISEIQQPCRNGTVIWVEISAKFRYAPKGDLEIVGVSRSIEDRKRAERQFLYQTYHDKLTGLYNRRYYEEALQRLDRPDCYPLALIIVDVNGLKLINDAFGHKTGDVLLEKVGGILEKQCQKNDVAARIGGDEFILLLPGCGEEKAGEITEQIQIASRRKKIDNVIFSLSTGFAVKSKESEKIEEIYKKAEDEMYRNKFYETTNVRSKTIDLILSTLYEKNPREMLHSKRVGEICEAVAKRMNLDVNEVNQIRMAGLMHDIGKIGIDEHILNKTDKLTSEEHMTMEKHVEKGWRILSSVNEYTKIAEYVLAHHERIDGKGYPQSRSGEKIPIGARIIAIADSYDAMTSLRTYRDPFTKENAIHEIVRCSGKQFDPAIACVFIDMLSEKEI